MPVIPLGTEAGGRRKETALAEPPLSGVSGEVFFIIRVQCVRKAERTVARTCSMWLGSQRPFVEAVGPRGGPGARPEERCDLLSRPGKILFYLIFLHGCCMFCLACFARDICVFSNVLACCAFMFVGTRQVCVFDFLMLNSCVMFYVHCRNGRVFQRAATREASQYLTFIYR